ncbi:hypothetical protein PAMA_022047 [Pampus argenteus]
MGKSSSKLRPRDELRCKDWKLINDQNPKKLAKLDKWITDYGFKGQLNSQQIIDLQDKIKQRTKYNPKKMKKCGYEDTEFWLQIALKREKGQRDLKINTAERDDKQLMFHRKEDDDTVNRYTRRRAEQAAAQAAQGGEAGVEQREAEEKRVLYPDLSELHAPPPEYTTPIDTTKAYSNTRSTNPFGYAWSKTLGQTLTPAPKINNPSGASALTTEDMYPMIEVANPNVEGDQPTMLIYRTWTMEDVKKALEGVPSHKEDIDLFIESMENVRKAYHLNGAEVQQIWMTALGSNWSHVRGDWNPKLDDAVLKPNDGELTNRVNALAQRARIRYIKRANYVEINRVKQKEDEPFEEYQIRMTKVFKANSGLHDDNNDAGPYRQQLKNALHAGSREPIRGWVERHNIGMSTCALDDYVNYALHAEKVITNKKNKSIANTFYQNRDEEIFYQNGRGRGGFRGRGQRRRGRGGRQYRGDRNFYDKSRTSHAAKWADLIADPKGYDWQSWTTNPTAKHQRKLLKIDYDNSKFVLTADLTGNNTLNPPGSSRSNTCWILLFWAWTRGADVGFPVWLCQLPPQLTNGGEKIEPKLSHVANGKGITATTSKLDADDWFLAYTGISKDINNWLLMAEQAANMTKTDCVVCLGPRPILRVTPSPVSVNCTLELMTKTNPTSSCEQWDRAFPLTTAEKMKPLFSKEIAPANFTCVNFIGGSERLGNLSSTFCADLVTLKQAHTVVSRSDIWWWCGDERLFDTFSKEATGLCALVDLERNAQLQLLLADFVSSSGCRVSIQCRHIQSPHMLTWRGTHSYSCYWLTLCHRQGVVFPFSVDIYNHRTCERVWRYGIYKYPVDLERNAQLQLLLADFVSSSGCRVSIQCRHIQSPHMLTWRGTHSYSCYWLTLCHRQGVVFPFSIDIYNHRTCERVWRYGIYKNPVDLERNAQLQLLLADFVSSSGCRVSIQCRHIQSPHMLTWRGTHSYSCYWLTLCHRQGVVFPFSVDIYNHRTCERVWRYGIYKYPVDLERNAQLQLLLADFVSSSGCRVSIQCRHIQSPHMLTWRGTHSYSCYWLTLCHRQGVVFPFSVDIYNHRTCERVWRYGIYKYPVDLERNAQLQLLLADFVSSSGCRVSIQCRHIQSPHMLTWRGTHSYSCYWLTLCHRQGVVFPFSIDIYNHRTCERVWRYGIYKNPVDLERNAQLQLLLADFVSSSGCRVSIQYRHIQSPHMWESVALRHL